MIGANLLDITMSLDHIVAAPNVGVPQPLGEEGDCLHNWLFGDGTTAPTEADREVSQEMFTQAGASVMGRQLSTPEKDHGAMRESSTRFVSICFLYCCRQARGCSITSDPSGWQWRRPA
jgi:hypothetical protein